MEPKTLKLLTLIFCFTSTLAESIEFTDCGQNYCFILDMDIEGCSSSDAICQFTLGEDYTVNVIVVPDFEVPNPEVSMYFKWSAAQYSVDVSPNDPCQAFTCPLKVSENHTYTSNMTVPTRYAPVSGQVYWSMTAALNRTEQMLCCGWFLANLVKPT